MFYFIFVETRILFQRRRKYKKKTTKPCCRLQMLFIPMKLQHLRVMKMNVKHGEWSFCFFDVKKQNNNYRYIHVICPLVNSSRVKFTCDSCNAGRKVQVSGLLISNQNDKQRFVFGEHLVWPECWPKIWTSYQNISKNKIYPTVYLNKFYF